MASYRCWARGRSFNTLGHALLTRVVMNSLHICLLGLRRVQWKILGAASHVSLFPLERTWIGDPARAASQEGGFGMVGTAYRRKFSRQIRLPRVGQYSAFRPSGLLSSPALFPSPVPVPRRLPALFLGICAPTSAPSARGGRSRFRRPWPRWMRPRCRVTKVGA